MSTCDDAKPHVVLEDSDLALIVDDISGEYVLNG
jgi:hypothetical protein